MRVLSIAINGDLPRARALARSLRRNQLEWEYEVALLGPLPADGVDDDELRMSSVQEELGLDIESLLARHDPARLVSLLVPRLLEKRCREGGGALLHLPVSVWVLQSLAPVEKALRERNVLLAPRVSGDLPADGLEPSRGDLALAGRLAPELMGVDGSPDAHSFLRWWIDRADSVLGGLGGNPKAHDTEDWRWLLRMLELVPARFSVSVLDDRGCNVSLWNLHEREVEEGASGFVVDGEAPLRFLDLPGFEPEHPYRLSPSATRARLSHMPALRDLAERYAQELFDAGWHELSGVTIGGRLANGLAFDHTMSYLYTTARALGQDFGDLFSTDGTEKFMAWLREPAPPWTTEGITRYVLQRVIRERSDVIAAFPDLHGVDSARFAEWWSRSGRAEMEVPQELTSALPPARAPAPPQAAPVPPTRVVSPPPQPEANLAIASDGAPLGVRVTGYLGHILGLGSAARGYASALAAAGVRLSTVTVPLDHLQAPVELAPEYGRHSYQDVISEGGHGFELVCVNADELPQVIERLGEDHFQGPRIGVWGWETNRIPDRWKASFALIDEIWVYSTFMAQNIGAVAPVPVVALPPPVEVPARNRASLRLGVPNGFLFMFLFDYLSTIQRKNPVGLIEAFKRAFAPGSGPQLLIKTINAPLRPLAEEEVLWAAEGRPDIHVIDRSLSGDEKDALMLACDCYVSLHRSEGFGLTMAEAMAIGKPVIGTGYSGNVDFMNDANSFLVRYAMTKVGPGCEIYPADGDWAEPDVEHAAAQMRRVYEQPEEAARVGARAREEIAKNLSPEATGDAMRRRLAELAALPPSRAQEPHHLRLDRRRRRRASANR